MRNKVTTILCDFDGVMVNRFTELSVQDFCLAYGVSKDNFARYSGDAAQGLDTGQKSTDEYFAEMIEKLHLDLAPADMKEFFAEADRRNIVRNENLYRWLSEVFEHGITVGLATNVSGGLAEELESMGLYDIFLKRYFSYKIGETKTDEKFWQYVLNDLKIEPNGIAFVDDNRDNVAVAKQVGLKGIVYKDFDQFLHQISPWIGQ